MPGWEAAHDGFLTEGPSTAQTLHGTVEGKIWAERETAAEHVGTIKFSSSIVYCNVEEFWVREASGGGGGRRKAAEGSGYVE